MKMQRNALLKQSQLLHSLGERQTLTSRMDKHTDPIMRIQNCVYLVALDGALEGASERVVRARARHAPAAP